MRVAAGLEGAAPTALPTAAQVLGFAGQRAAIERSVAVEMPVQVLFGDVPFAVMMMTPDDLDDFAYGFSLTEGVIARGSDIRGVAVETAAEGLKVRIALSGERLHAHLARKRALSGRTSCGLCGIEDLSALPRAAPAAEPPPRLSLAAIGRALDALDGHPGLNAATRAVHAAAWCDRSGRILHLREDVGRHNALDKLVGALLRDGIGPADGFALITSRASFEMIEKAAAFGARSLVAVSAPTSLAIERARALDITLVGIARRDGVTVFHGADRLDTEARP